VINSIRALNIITNIQYYPVGGEFGKSRGDGHLILFQRVCELDLEGIVAKKKCNGQAKQQRFGQRYS
jgi:hypothetical protein